MNDREREVTPAERELVRNAVSATLRTVAEWGLTWPDGRKLARDDLRMIAANVESLGPDDCRCPVCEEVECDEDCPLAGLRA